MFVVDDILISDRVVNAPFSCNLGACLGGCCVQGDSGAPLEEAELAELERVLPRVRKYLRKEAHEIIDRKGVWEERGEGEFVTNCVESRECVFVTYEGPIAKCAIQKAYVEGKVDFVKPVSCHLYPLRVERHGGVTVLNYENIPLCDSGRAAGCSQGIQLAEFLREPLIRRFGEAWYAQFKLACEERRDAFSASV